MWQWMMQFLLSILHVSEMLPHVVSREYVSVLTHINYTDAMRTILFVHGGKLHGDEPASRLALRLEWAIAYYRRHHEREDIIFFVSGRTGNVANQYALTEAEAGKRYILRQLPDVRVVKEDISVETAGNYAFSKPLVTALRPDSVVIIMSGVLKDKVTFLARTIWADAVRYRFELLDDELSGVRAIVERERKAFALTQALLSGVRAGDDAAVRDILLYRTPYYFKGVIDDKAFFDANWDGGYADFLTGLAVRSSRE